MGKIIRIKDFVNKCNALHNFKYNYSKVVYISAKDKVEIVCPVHGSFWQSAANHANGQGCKKCSIFKNKKLATRTLSQFLSECGKIHGNKYDYNLVEYIRSDKKVKIICSKHGIFEVSPSFHLQGVNCKKCSLVKLSLTTNKFIEKAKKIHGNLYDYSKVNYINCKTPVIIICFKHGEFEQLPNNHCKGNNCKICSYEFSNIRKSNWIKRANEKEGTFYIIRCWNENEEFWKLGITFRSVEKRYERKYDMPYNYEVVKIVKSKDLSYIWDLEKRFKRMKKKKHYSPSIKFDGSKYECFKN